MSVIVPFGHTAVMAQRHEAPDSLDLFCTPPWATRALIAHVLNPYGFGHNTESAWDPACGLGHITAVLEEFFAPVIGTDIFPHGGVHEDRPAGWLREQDFLDEREATPVVDWVITNPPFRLAEEFAMRAFDLAQVGVALLVRTAWLEGEGRWQRIFSADPPSIVAQFAERVPMVKGRWDPDASTATAYAWAVWFKAWHAPTRLIWIPPAQRRALTKADDARRLGAVSALPLLAGEERDA